MTEDVEAESFPLLLLDGEQLTAGSIPDRKAIEALLNETTGER